jgi:hypothetical protein
LENEDTCFYQLRNTLWGSLQREYEANAQAGALELRQAGKNAFKKHTIWLFYL